MKYLYMYMINMVNFVLNSIKIVRDIMFGGRIKYLFWGCYKILLWIYDIIFKKNVNCGLYCILFLKNIIYIIKIRYVDFVLKSYLI